MRHLNSSDDDLFLQVEGIMPSSNQEEETKELSAKMSQQTLS